MDRNSIYQQSERLQGALRDIVGLIPEKDRPSVQEDINLIEKLISDHWSALDRLRQIENIAARS